MRWRFILFILCATSTAFTSCSNEGKQEDAISAELSALDFKQVVSSYRKELTEMESSLKLSVVVSVEDPLSNCEFWIASYFTNHLCTDLPYILLDDEKVFIADKNNCLAPLIGRLRLYTDQCPKLSSNDKIAVPIYDPSIWVYQIENGAMVFQKRSG